jgi:hypothetical protein
MMERKRRRMAAAWLNKMTSIQQTNPKRFERDHSSAYVASQRVIND